jgi:hypothetical protein
MDIRNSRKIAIATLLLSMLALYASLMGVFDHSLYNDVYEAGTIPKLLIWGSKAQDIISIFIALLLAVISFIFLRNPGIKSFITMLGMVWYFFYAFGLYTIQGQYTSIYLVYMMIFGLSFYLMILGALCFQREEVKQYHIPEGLRKAISIFLFIIIVLLYPVWILRMSPDIGRHVPGSVYGVFILDLCLVFPAIGAIAYMQWKKKAFGNILAGAALIKVITLCLSWAFGELTNPLNGNPFSPEMAIISSLLTTAGLILFIPYIRKLKKS